MKLFSTRKIKSFWKEIIEPYPHIRGHCILCGKCCKSLLLTYRRKIVTTEKEYKKLLRWDYHIYSRFIPDNEQKEGEPLRFTCIHQDSENRCTVHSSRPDICKTYPHHSIFKLGAELEEGCGYRILTKGCFEDILEQKKQGTNNAPCSE